MANWLLVAGCTPLAPAVDRVADGVTEHGRYISYRSYAAYAHGAEFEALGAFDAAEKAYEIAMAYDPGSWEIWTRLGAVRCALQRPDARAAFSKAEGLAPDSASLWLAEARCELSRNNPARALDLAKRSLKLDPDDLETTRVISEALRRQGRDEEARRWLLALVARHPGSPAARIWLSGRKPANADEAPPPIEAVDAALLDAQPELARERALRIGLSEAELSAREVALGLTRQGFERASQVLRADPSDGSAWTVRVVAADLLRREDDYQRALSSDETALAPVDELSALLFADLLKRRAGPEAARSWLNQMSADGVSQQSDPLTSALRARLESELTSHTK